MKKLKVARRTSLSDAQALLPDLMVLLKYEMSAASREEVQEMCEKLIASGRLHDFTHPIRRTCYDLAMAGVLGNLLVPQGFMEMTTDPDRPSQLNTTVH